MPLPASRSPQAEEYPYQPQPAIIDDRYYGRDREFKLPEFFFAKGSAVYFAAISIGLFFAAVNFAVCPLMALVDGPANWKALPLFGLFGAVLSEAGLLSAALVFFSGPFWLRATLCWSVGFVLWGCWALGLMLVKWIEPWWDVGEILQIGTLSLPLVALAIQSPLWFARSYSGWRLKHQKSGVTATTHLSIRDYLVGTAITAISITLARLARPAHWPIEDYWPGWSIVFTSFGGGSLLSIVPAMLLIFYVRSTWLGLGLFLVYSLAVSAVIVAIMQTFSPGHPSTPELIGIPTLFFSLGAFLGIGLKLMHACGCTLHVGRGVR
jgi:hypothetical protein